MGLHSGVLQHRGTPDASNHEVAELSSLAVEGAQVPAQTGVDQGKGHDLSCGFATGDGVVVDAQRAALVNSAGDCGEGVEVGLGEAAGCHAGDAPFEMTGFAVTEAVG